MNRIIAMVDLVATLINLDEFACFFQCWHLFFIFKVTKYV